MGLKVGQKIKRVTEEEKHQIVHDYTVNRLSSIDISLKYNRAQSTVMSVLHQHGVSLHEIPVIYKYQAGDVIGEWTVVEKIPYKRNEEKKYKCRCSCGRESIIKQTSLLQNKSSKCKTCATRINGKKNRGDDFEVGIKSVFQMYKSNAKRRKLPFELSQEQFTHLVKQNCYYCNEPPSNVFHVYAGKVDHSRETIYNGIDRVDSLKGYTVDNCVPCCYHCNVAKFDYTTEQFLQWIKKIYVYQFKRLAEKTPGVMADELFTINMKLWYEQEKIINFPEDSKEALDAAKKAQELNAKRNRVMRALDSLLGFEEASLTEKTYDKEK